MRVATVIDIDVLRVALAVAATTGGTVEIVPVYRVRCGPNDTEVECDSSQEVLDYARTLLDKDQPQ